VTAEDAQELLREARRAWAQLNQARSQLARLARYARLTPGMKDDRNRWSKQASDAEATIARILGS
jgi:acyl-ACP thioesterase